MLLLPGSIPSGSLGFCNSVIVGHQTIALPGEQTSTIDIYDLSTRRKITTLMPQENCGKYAVA